MNPRYAAYLAAHGFASQQEAIERTGSNAHYMGWIVRAWRAFAPDRRTSEAKHREFDQWLASQVARIEGQPWAP